jgi:hypothetical protein
MLLGHWALSYLAKGVLPGQRRALLTAQVDDVFLSTGEADDDVAAHTWPAEGRDDTAGIAWVCGFQACQPSSRLHEIGKLYVICSCDMRRVCEAG